MEKRKKAIDTLKNQKVIARSDVDGFYYQGSVVRSISKKHALVDFCQGENQIIPITFIIPTGGAVPNPPLKVGDFVFSKTSTGSGCYVPAVVIATPRTEAADKLYSVLKYNNRKEQCVRRQLIKISPSQYDFSCRYIRKAQMVDYTISNVQFVNPIKSSTVSEDKKHKKLKKERSHGTSEEKNVITVKPDEPNKDLYLQNDITEEAPKHRDTAVEEKLKNLAFQVSQYQKEQSEHEQAIEQYLKELAVLKSRQDKCPTEKAQKDVAKQQIDLLQQLKKLTPISNVHRKNAISNDRSPINEPDEDKKYDCPLLPGQKILALCPYNGWYEEGSIVHDCGDSSYFIQMSHGELSRIWREDLYSDADDYKQDIQVHHPLKNVIHIQNVLEPSL
uniref:DUF4537 domain-containing protein n=1 Tax=Leptobrachium leishanense TaxID=445787 RepID=A0A8C5P7Y9_9ANUR